MVLISFKHRFVLLKSMKTAGTSVEAHMLNSLLGEVSHDEVFPEVHNELVYSSARSLHYAPLPSLLKSHASLDKIYRVFPQTTEYEVAVCVRNPFDRILSYYWWRESRHANRYALLRNLPTQLVRTLFNSWLADAVLPKNFPIERLLAGSASGGPPRTIRYETLEMSVQDWLSVLGIDSEDALLPALKAHQRPSGKLFGKEAFTANNIEKVSELLRFEFENFDYSRSPIRPKRADAI